MADAYSGSSSSSELSHCSDTGNLQQESRPENMFSSVQGLDHPMPYTVQQSQVNPVSDSIARKSEYLGERATQTTYSNIEQHGLQSHSLINSQLTNYPDKGQRFESMTSLERTPYHSGQRQQHQSSPDMHSRQTSVMTDTDDLETVDRALGTYKQEQQQHYEHVYTAQEGFQITRHKSNRDVSNEAMIQKVICFDMDKVNKIACAFVRKFNVTSTLSAKTVADVFGKVENDIRIVERDALPAGHPARTLVILAKNAITSMQYVIVEFLMISDKPFPELLCVRIPVDGISVHTLSNDISREISVKKVVVCENGHLLSDETVIKNEDKGVRRFKAVHDAVLKITCFHHPTKNVESRFEMETSSGANVASLRKEFSTKFSEAIRVDDDQRIHFSFKCRILDDDECVGTLTWPNKDRVLQVHIASHKAVCVNLKFKETVGKNKIPHSKNIAVDPNLSTANLRNEVSKHMGIVPKAVKLTLNSRRIEETNRLKDIWQLQNGCTLFAGVKKTKTIRVKDTSTKREETFCIYMLEPVYILKQMIAEKFAINPLHVTLEYKERRLSDNELLLNYPIKNQTEIKMYTFPNRINVPIYMAFNKTRTILTVDHSDRTTVDELIRFCALTFNFDRRCARVQHCDRCLSRFLTLSEEQLQSDSQVVLVHFDPPEKPEGGLIRIYSVWPDGQIDQGIGAVNGGHLLHASTRVKSCQGRCQNNRTVEQLPQGIQVYEELVHVEPELVAAKPKQAKFPKGGAIKIGDTASELKALKKKFMKKAKRVNKNVDSSSVEMSDLKFPHPEKNGPLNTPISSLSISEFDFDSNTGVKMIYNATTAGKSPPEEDCMTLEIAKHVSCIEGCCFNIKTVLGTSSGSDRSFIMEEEGRDVGKPGYGDTSGSANDLLTLDRRVEFTLGTESSDQEAGNVVAQAAARQTLNEGGYDISRCPYIRRRTRTEGEVYVPNLNHGLMPHILTYPFMEKHGNEWLNTAGITITILVAVGKKIGLKWKNLARRLSIAEYDIENIEANKIDLQEKSFAMILLWKKAKGTAASKEVLVQALRDIEMVAAAEFIEQLCDYRTV